MASVKPAAIADYAFLSDCHGSALVSREGSVDWCCLPRFDASPVFGRLLDPECGGWCGIRPSGAFDCSREYLAGTLVLATTFEAQGGRVRVVDCLVAGAPRRGLLRVIEGVEGSVALDIDIHPRFDYGGVRPWVRALSGSCFSAIGGNDALVITGDVDLKQTSRHDLAGHMAVEAGQRRRLLISYWAPEDVDPEPPVVPSGADMDRALDETVGWWQQWASSLSFGGPLRDEAIRSALVLKGLTYEPTGAVAAAPTTSLPEVLGGSRNWDYRYAWIRDSQFTVRSLTEVGCEVEAERFRRFIERTAAGSAESLQIMYGVGGERRLNEQEVDLAGYAGSTPVRVGNAAAAQRQLDVFGYLAEHAWRWHERGHSPGEEFWEFLISAIDRAAEEWQEPDCGIWEMRGRPQHFVHSKVMCWAAVDRGLRLAADSGLHAPVERWSAARAEIRAAVEHDGYDAGRGVFRQAFGVEDLDAALLLVPTVDFVAAGDERMVRTTDAIAADLATDLADGGLVRRYRSDDRMEGEEGAFLACTFWLAEILVLQGRRAEAREWFGRARAAANDLGLFSEECSASGELLGNFPQGMTHLSHLAAAVALTRAP